MTTPDDVVSRLRAAGCVWAEDEAALLREAAGSDAELDGLVARRVGGEPLELVLGWVAFLDRRLLVAPGTFVPRRRTELLARAAREEVGRRAATVPVVVEMCCGVGPVAASLEGLHAVVHAADLDEVALGCARANAPSASLHRGDLYDALPATLAGRVDVLVANAPYVPTGSIARMPPEARQHEPRVALDGGPDGVDVHRRLAGGVRPWLAPGGVVLVETSPGQLPLTRGALERAGLDVRSLSDEEVGGCVAVGVSRSGAGPA